MTAQTNVSYHHPAATPANDYVLLRRVLFADTMISVAAGLAMALFSRPIEEFLGGKQPDVLLLLGIVLIVFGVFNFITARETPLSRMKAWFIFEFNVLWVIASVVAVAANLFELNTTGNLVTLAVAANTAVIAFLEWFDLRRGAARQ